MICPVNLFGGGKLDCLGGKLPPFPGPLADETLIKTHWSSNWSRFSHQSIFTLKWVCTHKLITLFRLEIG